MHNRSQVGDKLNDRNCCSFIKQSWKNSLKKVCRIPEFTMGGKLPELCHIVCSSLSWCLISSMKSVAFGDHDWSPFNVTLLESSPWELSGATWLRNTPYPLAQILLIIKDGYLFVIRDVICIKVEFYSLQVAQRWQSHFLRQTRLTANGVYLSPVLSCFAYGT